MVIQIWKLTNAIIEGPSGLLVLQSILYWIGLGLIVQFALNNRGLVAKALALVFVGFFPVTWFMMASVWKDALMLSTILFSLGLYLAIRKPIKSQKSKFWFFLLPVIWLFLMVACGVRHNAITAVIPLVFMMTFDLMQARAKWFVKVLFSCTFILSMVFASKKINQIGVEVRYPYLINQLVFWNLAGLSIESDEMLIPVDAFENADSANVEVLKRYYNDASNNSIVFGSGIIKPKVWEDPEYGKAFFNTGLRSIINHPADYVRIRIRSLNELVGNGRWRPYMAYIFHTSYWKGDENLDLKRYAMNHESALLKIENDLITRLSRFGFYNLIPYLSLLLIVLTFLFFRPNSEQRLFLLGMGISALLYWLPYLIIAPSNDFRYSNWTIEVVVLSITIMTLNGISDSKSLKRILKNAFHFYE